MDGDPDRPGLVGDRARDRLADPPGGVRRELEALRVVELLDGPDQTEVPLLDEVEEQHPPVAVALGDGHDEAKVGLDELLFGFPSVQYGPLLPAPVGEGDAIGAVGGLQALEPAGAVDPGLDPAGELNLCLAREEGDLADLLEVGPHRVGARAPARVVAEGAVHGRPAPGYNQIE